MKRRILIAALAVLLPAAVIVFTLVQRQASLEVPARLASVLWPQAKPLQPFSLVDHTGKAFTQEHLEQGFSLLFFGYTSCPDVCPTTMASLDVVMRELGKDCAHCQVVFVSVDPQRDTAERLHAYTSHFNPQFIALTGSVESITELAAQMGAMFIQEPSESAESYTMAHTASVFLIDPQARLIGTFSFPHDPLQMAEDLRQIFKLRS
jgi:protein SCO1/2